MTANQLFQFIGHFTPIYQNGVLIPPPDKLQITVWCDDDSIYSGFALNTTWEDMGLEALGAKSWILHSELERVAGQTIE